jgi:hypothetical protein
MSLRLCLCASVRLCVCASVRLCVCASVRLCVCVCACVRLRVGVWGCARQLDVPDQASVQDSIVAVLRLHRSQGKQPPLYYKHPSCYELRLHEGDGFADEVRQRGASGAAAVRLCGSQHVG